MNRQSIIENLFHKIDNHQVFEDCLLFLKKDNNFNNLEKIKLGLLLNEIVKKDKIKPFISCLNVFATESFFIPYLIGLAFEDSQCLKYFIEKGYHLNFKNHKKDNKNFLMYLFENNISKETLELSMKDNFKLNEYDLYGQNLFFYSKACYFDILIKYNVYINSIDHSGYTALMRFSETRDVEKVIKLIELGAAKYLKNQQGLSFLDIAPKKDQNIYLNFIEKQKILKTLELV